MQEKDKRKRNNKLAIALFTAGIVLMTIGVVILWGVFAIPTIERNVAYGIIRFVGIAVTILGGGLVGGAISFV